MTGALTLLALSVTLGLGTVAIAGGIGHPLVVYYAVWSVVFAVDAINPLGLPTVTGQAISVMAVGQAAVFAGAVVFGAFVPRAPRGGALLAVDHPYAQPGSSQEPTSSPSEARLWVGIAVLAITVVVGISAFQHGVESAAGLPESALSASEIRALSGTESVAHAGVATLGLTLAALLAACGVIIAERRRGFGWTIAALGIAATTVSPQRTNTLTALGLVFALWLYRRSQQQSLRRSGAYIVVLGVVAIAIGGTLFFNTVGNRLGKSTIITQAVGETAVPRALVPLTAYLTASPSALSTTLSDHIDPTTGNHLRSVWLLPRALSILVPSTSVPNTVSAFTNISFPFNTYTWQGDVFFDFGMLGVAVAGLAIGALVAWVHRLALRRRSVFSAWLAAVVSIVSLLGIIEFAFFWLEVSLWAFAGWAVLGAGSRRASGGLQTLQRVRGRQRLSSAS